MKTKLFPISKQVASSLIGSNLLYSNTMMKRSLIYAGALSFLAFGCNTTDPEPTPYESGVFVLNAGNFSDNNGSISLVSRNSVVASTDIFRAANSRPITGGVQGYAEIDGKGLILVDNSTAGQDKVELVEVGTFKSLATLVAPDIENPRYVVQVAPNKAYVSCWGATGDFSNFYPNPGYVAVVDMARRQVIKKITVAKGAEQMVVNDSEVFVGSVGGEKGLTVIDLATDEVKQTVELANNPRPIGIDATGQLWVYAAKEMIQMNARTKAIGSRLKINSPAHRFVGPIAFGRDRQNIFFSQYYYDAADGYKQKGETYNFSIRDAAISLASPFLRRTFTALGVDPNSQVGTLYAGVTPSYKQAGYVVRYNSSNAQVIDSVRVEIAPSGFYFK